jgi:pimeloyl-ACP methyl ester carboxylesterase
LRAAVQRPELGGVIRQSGAVAASADTGMLVEVLRRVAGCDLGRVLATYEAFTVGAGPSLVAGLRLPALLVAGRRDPFVPPGLIKEMAEAIPGARLEVYDDATHYLPLEYPARLSTDLRNLLSEVD